MLHCHQLTPEKHDQQLFLLKIGLIRFFCTSPFQKQQKVFIVTWEKSLNEQVAESWCYLCTVAPDSERLTAQSDLLFLRAFSFLVQTAV